MDACLRCGCQQSFRHHHVGGEIGGERCRRGVLLPGCEVNDCIDIFQMMSKIRWALIGW